VNLVWEAQWRYLSSRNIFFNFDPDFYCGNTNVLEAENCYSLLLAHKQQKISNNLAEDWSFDSGYIDFRTDIRISYEEEEIEHDLQMGKKKEK